MKRHSLVRKSAWLLLSLSFLLPKPARAESSVPQQQDALSVERRLTFIEESLASDARRSRIWLRSWQGAFGALTVGQLAVVPFVGDGDRIDLYFGAASTAVGLAALAFVPPSILQASQDFAAQRQSATTLDQRIALLEQSEQVFRLEAKREAAAVGVWSHTANVLFNIGLGLGLGLGYDRWESAAISIGTGILLGEVLILTQPSDLQKKVEDYDRGDWNSARKSPISSWSLAPVIHPGREYSLQASVTF